jgi:hypothetical protein
VTNVRTGSDGASYDAPADGAVASGTTALLLSKQQTPETGGDPGNGRVEMARAEALSN